MTWNYRVIRRTDEGGETEYGVHECFYHKPGDTIPHSWTINPVAPRFATIGHGFQCIEKPVLEELDGELVEVEPSYLSDSQGGKKC